MAIHKMKRKKSSFKHHILKKDKKIKLWSLEEGERFNFKDTVVRIEGPYSEFGVFETVI